MNSVQLRESIKHEYGSGLDAAVYLNKFIHIWADLPKAKPVEGVGEDNNKKYIDYCAKKISALDGIELKDFSTLCNFYELSFREIERCLTYICYFNKKVNCATRFMALALFYLVILKVKFTDTFYSMAKKEITEEELLPPILFDRLAVEANELYLDMRQIAIICSSNSHNKARSARNANSEVVDGNYDEITELFTSLTNFGF